MACSIEAILIKQKRVKLNRLQRLLPAGLLADATWFTSSGYSSSLRSRYVASGWLQPIIRGVFRYPSYELDDPDSSSPLLWQHVVISLQSVMKRAILVGGRTALELDGLAHYLSSTGLKEVHLYGYESVPGWLGKLPMETPFIYHNAKKLFPDEPISLALENVASTPDSESDSNFISTRGSLTTTYFGEGNWPIVFSTRERAILELLDDLPDNETFHQVDMFLEGLVHISPKRMSQLLRQCRSIKVKRLFFWFAERHRHPWIERLDRAGVNLGHGKRMLFKGGTLDPKYKITVPRDLDAGR